MKEYSLEVQMAEMAEMARWTTQRMRQKWECQQPTLRTYNSRYRAMRVTRET